MKIQNYWRIEMTENRQITPDSMVWEPNRIEFYEDDEKPIELFIEIYPEDCPDDVERCILLENDKRETPLAPFAHNVVSILETKYYQHEDRIFGKKFI